MAITVFAKVETWDEFDIEPETETLMQHFHAVDPSDAYDVEQTKVEYKDDLTEQGYNVLEVWTQET